MDELEFTAMHAERLAELLKQAVRGDRVVTSEVALLAADIASAIDRLWKATRG